LTSSETGKARTVSINKDNFKTDDDAVLYARELQKENREKNKLYKIDKTHQKLETLVKRNVDTTPSNNIEIQSNVNMEIDPGTGSTVCIYGASKRGKTTLMMYLYDKYFSSTKKVNTLFSGNPHLNIYKNDPNLLISYGFNATSAKYIKLQQFINTKCNNKYHFTNLFDDIIDQKYAPIMNKLILTYRNSNISSIMCLQYVYLLSKQNRSSVNHTFVFGANSNEDCENMINLLLRPHFRTLGLVTLGDQVAFFKKMTENHGFIYLDNIKNRISFHRLEIN
jgi:Cdc6-like AAA superfamily ATPase